MRMVTKVILFILVCVVLAPVVIGGIVYVVSEAVEIKAVDK